MVRWVNKNRGHGCKRPPQSRLACGRADKVTFARCNNLASYATSLLWLNLGDNSRSVWSIGLAEDGFNSGDFDTPSRDAAVLACSLVTGVSGRRDSSLAITVVAEPVNGPECLKLSANEPCAKLCEFSAHR